MLNWLLSLRLQLVLENCDTVISQLTTLPFTKSLRKWSRTSIGFISMKD